MKKKLPTPAAFNRTADLCSKMETTLRALGFDTQEMPADKEELWLEALNGFEIAYDRGLNHAIKLKNFRAKLEDFRAEMDELKWSVDEVRRELDEDET